MPLSRKAETLKNEGNTFYSNGNHKAAIVKYTAAIKIASDNAVLFANRAAAHLGLEQYEKALEDAGKATDIDPKYAKGWGRLGAAFEGVKKYEEALAAYGQAIHCIDSTSNISDADKRLKAQYKEAHTNLEVRRVIIKGENVVNAKMPWELAPEGIALELDLSQPSSGYIISKAAKDFAAAKSIIKTLTTLPGPTGMVFGQSGGLDDLSNAIMTDERCIFMRGGETLLKDINKYQQFEATRWGAWFSVTKPQEVIRLAKNRLRQSNGDWDTSKVRPALGCQARAWIIMGCLGSFSQSHDQLFLWYDRTCKLIELGRKEWSNIHRDDRGTIFDDTFLRGVRVLRMNQYLKAYGVKHLRNKFTLDGLLALADELLDELENFPPEMIFEMLQEPKYFYLAFFLYPRACAWGIRGFVYLRKGASLSLDRDLDLEGREWAKKAGDAYIKAADLYPEDDEHHCFMLQAAIESYSAAKITAREMLVVLTRLRLAYPKMQRIWKNSLTALQGAHKKFVNTMQAEDEFRKAMDEGKFTLDDHVMLQFESVLDN